MKKIRLFSVLAVITKSAYNENKAVYTAALVADGGQERKASKSDFVTDGPTDRRTDGPTKWLIESRVRD